MSQTLIKFIKKKKQKKKEKHSTQKRASKLKPKREKIKNTLSY
jgi:hypothetical protein